MSAIIFDNVSKRFLLHHEKTRSVQDLMLKKLRRTNGHAPIEEFWALRDVSFEIPQGQSVGILGPNGAGKSTTLKLIAHIYEPTRGKVTVNGRLNALIEIGAGFHEELTGRENIYLSAALLGLSRKEIQSRFDDIVEFSELEQFIDTPVKHYSSGMHMRLGFAIATCIESEVLLVDEVLAVGDASFQRKCLKRIGEIRQRGTTIFYVSHQIAEIERICDRALLIMNGRLVADGKPAEAAYKYLNLLGLKRKDLRPSNVEAIQSNESEPEDGKGTVAGIGAKPKPVEEKKSPDFYHVEYLECRVPGEMRVGERSQITVTLRNASPQVWNGLRGAGPHLVSVSYHWLDEAGEMHQFIGPRTILPVDLRPGETITVNSLVLPPATPGAYRLQVDLAAEWDTWFSAHGQTGPQFPVKVLPAEGEPRKETRVQEELLVPVR